MSGQGKDPGKDPGEHLRSLAPRDRRPVNAEMVNDRAKLIMHRLIAKKLRCDPDVLAVVRERLDRFGDDAPKHVCEWKAILRADVDTVRKRLTERSLEMTRLRLSSPLVGVIPLEDLNLRRRIYQKAKLGVR